MLTPQQLQMIKTIVFSKLDAQTNTAFIFGSRASGTYEKFSDIDIGIEGKPLSSDVTTALREAFEESDLPYNVDVVDFSTLRDGFKDIAKQHVVYL